MIFVSSPIITFWNRREGEEEWLVTNKKYSTNGFRLYDIFLRQFFWIILGKKTEFLGINEKYSINDFRLYNIFF